MSSDPNQDSTTPKKPLLDIATYEQRVQQMCAQHRNRVEPHFVPRSPFLWSMRHQSLAHVSIHTVADQRVTVFQPTVGQADPVVQAGADLPPNQGTTADGSVLSVPRSGSVQPAEPTPAAAVCQQPKTEMTEDVDDDDTDYPPIDEPTGTALKLLDFVMKARNMERLSLGGPDAVTVTRSGVSGILASMRAEQWNFGRSYSSDETQVYSLESSDDDDDINARQPTCVKKPRVVDCVRKGTADDGDAEVADADAAGGVSEIGDQLRRMDWMRPSNGPAVSPPPPTRNRVAAESSLSLSPVVAAADDIERPVSRRHQRTPSTVVALTFD